MKKVTLNLMTLLAVIFLFKSCSKDDNSEENISTIDITTVKSTVASGDWRITYFFDTDKDETSNFTGYVFTFNSDGTLGASDGNTSISGAWSITDSDSSDDDSSDDIDFNIFFTTPDNFEELSEDWEILKYTNTKIELIHVSGGNGGTDLLTFTKN